MSAISLRGGIIFDLDGTLVDSAPDITASLNVYFATQRWPLLKDDFVAQYIGHGTQRLMHDILQALDLPHDDATVQKAVIGYLRAYYENPVLHTRLYPQVENDLRALHADGYRLGVCTNKQQALTEQVLAGLGIDGLFTAVVGADAVPACKPDPGHLFATAERMGLMGLMGSNVTHWVYVGDSRVDQATATAADVPFYAVPWGTGAALHVPPPHRLTRLLDLQGAF